MSAATTAADDRNAEAGFSVLELIVALALLSLVLAAIPGLVTMSRRAWATAANVERTASESVVEAFVAERIAGALPIFARREDGTLSLAFSGTPQSLRFTTPVTDGPMGPGLFDVEFAAALTPSGRNALVLHWQPFAPGRQTAFSAERILLADLETFGLRYFGYVAESGRREWSAAWTDTRQLPELIEVRLATRGQRPRVRVIPLLARDVP